MAKPETLPPLPTSNGSVKVQLLDGGSFTADYNFLHAGAPSTPFRCYSWAFYIHHEPSGRRILWDVGLSANRSEYTAFNVKHVLDVLEPVNPRLSIIEQLENSGTDANAIDTVIFRYESSSNIIGNESGLRTVIKPSSLGPLTTH
ncbi:Lactamase-B domain-containing protein [Fusarium sp. Ph1]|nr:Lactamase-B domain-containing protein [Fusarium sp. Ph1]